MTLDSGAYDTLKAFSPAFTIVSRGPARKAPKKAAAEARASAVRAAADAADAADAAGTGDAVGRELAEFGADDAGDAVQCIVLPKRTAIVADMMAGLEPRSDECGQMTRAAAAAFEHTNGRAPSEEESTLGQTATFTGYVAARLRFVERFLEHPDVHFFAAMFDRGSPPAKYPEQNLRYGTDADDVASDAEVDAVLAGSVLPHEWKRFRGNPRFRDAIMGMVVSALIALPLQKGKKLCIVGNPTTARAESHIPIVFESGTPPMRITTPSMCLDYHEADFGVVHFALGLSRLGYNVVVRAVDGDTLLSLLLNAPRHADAAHLAAMHTAFSAQPRMRAQSKRKSDDEAPDARIDSETDTSATAKRSKTASATTTTATTTTATTTTATTTTAPQELQPAGASASEAPVVNCPWRRRIYLLRELPTAHTLVDIQTLYELTHGTHADAVIGHTTRPRCAPELVVAFCMLLGNDYALKFLPRVGAKTLCKAMCELADDMAHLVTSTPPHTLAADLTCAHEIRVSRSVLQRLVDYLYRNRGIASSKPSAALVDVATAALEYTLNYFANAPNPHVPAVDAYARSGAGLSMHGFEWRDPTLPPSRANARYAERVHIAGRFL